MDDIGSAIQGFLAQPGAMEQLEAMAKQLGLGQAQQDGTADTAEPSEMPDAVETGGFSLGELGNAGGLGDLLPGGLSPERLGKIMQAVSAGNQHDHTTAFLEALRPLLKNEKQEKLDRALRAVRLMRTAKAVSKSIEL